MRTQPEHSEDASRELGCRRDPHPTAPSSHPEAEGRETCASIPWCWGGPEEEQRPQYHPALGSEPLPPRRGQSLRSIAGMWQAASAGPHPARRARAVIHIPPPHPPGSSMSHRCPCAATHPAAAETMSAMLAGSRGGRGNQTPPSPQRRPQELGALRAVWGPQPQAGGSGGRVGGGWIPTARRGPRQSRHQEGARMGNSPSNNHKQAREPGRVWLIVRIKYCRALTKESCPAARRGRTMGPGAGCRGPSSGAGGHGGGGQSGPPAPQLSPCGPPASRHGLRCWSHRAPAAWLPLGVESRRSQRPPGELRYHRGPDRQHPR